MSRFRSLSSRVAVAVPGIGLFAAVALIDSDPFTTVFFAVLAAIAAAEAVRLLGSGRNTAAGIIAAILTGGAAAGVALLPAELSLAIIVIPGLMVSLVWVLIDGVDGSRMKTAGITGLTALSALGFGIMARFRMDFGSPWVMFIPLFICWVGDSLAYFAGSAFGRHRMAPVLSPSKSWEGFAAGIAGSVAGSLGAGSLGAGFPLSSMAALGFIGGVAAVAGDLFESAMKRDAGVKDSGVLLPGHGGLLDRFDSLLAVVPVVWIVLFLLSRWDLL